MDLCNEAFCSFAAAGFDLFASEHYPKIDDQSCSHWPNFLSGFRLTI